MTTWRAAAAYLAVALVMTWPLATGLARDIPADLGDPVFVAWVLARGLEHWTALFTGDLDAPLRFWHAGQFYPEPWTTAYSDHFAGHALQALPVWWATGNVILCYNLLFLSTYVLGGLGMFLFVREVTGRPWAAWVAGLAFAFAPHRVAAISHLHQLSTQWMPFALYALRRYFVTGRRRPLAGAAGAVALQNLASGYHLMFFAPVVTAYALVEVFARRLQGRLEVWRDLAVTGGVALLVTAPFAVPYNIVRLRLNYRRTLAEVDAYSADLVAWFTAPPALHLWGWLHPLPRPEGLLFPGATLLVLAAGGAILAARGRTAPGRPLGVFLIATIVWGVWMAAGPVVRWNTSEIPVPSLHRLFYDVVPGWSMVRAPARVSPVVVMALAALAGVVLARVDAPRRRWALAAGAVLILAEGAALPLTFNRVWTSHPGLAEPPARIHPAADAPRVYRYLRTLPESTVLAHFPFGPPEREIQALYYSSVHGKPMLNGYSGAFPRRYQVNAQYLTDPLAHRDTALTILRGEGVTHAVIDTAAWLDGSGRELVAWLESEGAIRLARFDDYVVLQLPWV